jgi:hypothetical protein
MGNRLAVCVSCDYTPMFFVSPSLLGDDGLETDRGARSSSSSLS